MLKDIYIITWGVKMKTSLKKFRNLIFCLLMMFDGLLSSQLYINGVPLIQTLLFTTLSFLIICGVMYLFDRKINKMK